MNSFAVLTQPFRSFVVRGWLLWALAWHSLPYAPLTAWAVANPPPAEPALRGVRLSREAELQVTRVLDRNIPWPDRLPVLRQLRELPLEEKQCAFGRILLEGDEDFSAQAALSLVHDRRWTDCARDSLLEGLPRLSYGFQHRVLWAIQVVGSPPELLEIPRAVMQRATAPNAQLHLDQSHVAAVERAVFILATAGSDADRERLSAALEGLPICRGIWFALGIKGPPSEKERESARRVYQDPEVAEDVRVAAALLSEDDHEVEEFATRSVRKFLDSYASRNALFELVVAQRERPPAEAEKAAYQCYEREIGLLSTLLFLKTESAESITFEFLRSKDHDIRATLGFIAVHRWPQRFLRETDARTFPQDEPGEYDRLLAAVAFLHPELTVQAFAKSDKEAVQAALDRLREGGLETLAVWFGDAAQWLPR